MLVLPILRSPAGKAYSRLTGNKYIYNEHDVSEILNLFRWVAERLRNLPPVYHGVGDVFLGDAPRHINPTGRFAQHLANYIICHRENSRIDYRDPKTFLAFDTLYFFRNFLKCLFAAHHLRAYRERLGTPQTVLDIGSGDGPFTLACELLNAFPKSRYVLIDYGRLQSYLAEELFEFLGFNNNTEIVKADVFSCLTRRGLKIASYWLCGNKEAVLHRDDQELRHLIRDGLVLVDYQKNILAFAERAEKFSHDWQTIEISAPVPKDLQALVDCDTVNVHCLVVFPQKH